MCLLVGNASRQCDSNGNWGTPVYINCVNEILHKTSEKLKKLEQITNTEQATAAISDILDTVDNTTGDHNDKPLKSGDLKQTTSILSSIIQIGNSKNASVNSEKFADVLNSVLNTENSHSWNEVNTHVSSVDPKISCGYWNFSSRSWTYDGCYLKMSDSKVSTCTCNHLTNFAILMSPSDVEISDANKKALEIITFVGCGLSILGCFLTLIIYAVFWSCWLNTSNFVFMSFVGPALLIILMNIGTIIIVLRAVYSRKGIQNETLKKKARDGIKCMVTLLPVLGLSWLFGILAFNEDTIIFQYLFGITTSCQVQEGFRQTMHRRRAKSMSNFSSKPKSSGTNDRFDSKDSNTDSTILKDMKKETPRKYELRAFLKLNKSQAYEVAKA
ncbi:unnamed protein product [Mytilus edulis]|uniref:GAIN-B domain-containing protein n=1 Tax=Mytilus edulis TaxID=6550 RepID=A0A8S3PYJ6_MYTED|nr:unnamed protein product [Mytilus edulis]